MILLIIIITSINNVLSIESHHIVTTQVYKFIFSFVKLRLRKHWWQGFMLIVVCWLFVSEGHIYTC